MDHVTHVAIPFLKPDQARPGLRDCHFETGVSEPTVPGRVGPRPRVLLARNSLLLSALELFRGFAESAPVLGRALTHHWANHITAFLCIHHTRPFSPELLTGKQFLLGKGLGCECWGPPETRICWRVPRKAERLEGTAWELD